MGGAIPLEQASNSSKKGKATLLEAWEKVRCKYETDNDAESTKIFDIF
jgi:hypothetical protein